MQSSLQRLYKTKLTLLAVITGVVGIALLVLAQWIDTNPRSRALRVLPMRAVGGGVFTTALVVYAFTYLDKRDAEARAMEQLDVAIKRNVSAIRDSVIDGFAAAPESLTSVAAPAVLDHVIENCLAIQLDDKQLAHDVYADIKAQVLHSQVRQRDLKISVSLAPWDKGPAAGAGSMFVATVSYEYRVVPVDSTLRFSCVSDLSEYRDLSQDPRSTLAWYFEPIAGLDAASSEAFMLLHVTVDGVTRPVRHSARGRNQFFTAAVEPDAVAVGKEVTVAYTFSTLVQRHGHLLHLDIAAPTKGLHVEFFYGGCGIRYVNVLDYIAAAKQPTISRVPADAPSPSVSLSFDGWIMPKGGAGFVWVLDDEVGTASKVRGMR